MEVRPDVGTSGGADGVDRTRRRITRGFLFADLRGYTAFVERRGAATAASLLQRYRRVVREAVGRYGGAEIRTEGDGFYVVFDSVADAVECAVAIVAAAASESIATPDEPIAAAVGVHAGETFETDEGYVGSAVNIAARVCAQARPGEVLVTETVRDLTRNLLAVRFEARGRRRLKGVDGAVAVFAAVDGATVEARRPSRRMSVAPAALALGALALVVAAAFLISRHAAGLPPGTWTIAVGTLPASAGGTLDQNTSDAARLALDTINAGGGIGGRTIGFEAVDAGDDEEAAGPAARAIVSDSSVVAMIGPAFSGHAAHMIPVTNEAGLLECSPSATLPQLTKPSKGSLSLRAAHPDRINFVRLAPAEDIQAPGMAAFAYRDLAAPVVLLVDDGDLGLVVADPFEAAFRDLGGSVVRRTLRPGTDPKPAVDELRGPDPPRVVFYAGRNRRDAAALRTAMVGAGQGDVPLLSWDAIVDGSGATPGSFLQLAGRAAANTYAAHASVPPMKASFATEFRTRFGREPDEYAAAAYACVEIIADGLREAADRGVGASELRDAVRRSVADDTRSHDTVVGSVRFDGNGDTRQQFVTFYRVDASAANGAGDWIVWKQQDFGPAPE